MAMEHEAIQVGRTMEITREDARLLTECALAMQSASRGRRKGWLMEYLRAHRTAHGVFNTILTRSHAN